LACLCFFVLVLHMPHTACPSLSGILLLLFRCDPLVISGILWGRSVPVPAPRVCVILATVMAGAPRLGAAGLLHHLL
jgi:hypothetical protein